MKNFIKNKNTMKNMSLTVFMGLETVDIVVISYFYRIIKKILD
jgi:hypothetical protein